MSKVMLDGDQIIDLMRASVGRGTATAGIELGADYITEIQKAACELRVTVAAQQARIAELEKELATAQAFAHWVVIERDKLQKICAATYQLAGLVGAPERFLDALSRHEYTEDLLPVRDEEIECMAQLAELRRGVDNLKIRSYELGQHELYCRYWRLKGIKGRTTTGDTP